MAVQATDQKDKIHLRISLSMGQQRVKEQPKVNINLVEIDPDRWDIFYFTLFCMFSEVPFILRGGLATGNIAWILLPKSIGLLSGVFIAMLAA